LDFETHYTKDYSLSKMSTEAYIRSNRFEVIGVGVKDGDKDAEWFSGSYTQINDYLHSLNIHKRYLLAHNTAFDGAILAWHFNIRPQYYLDTLSMSRPVTGATVGGSLKKLAKQFLLGEKGDEVIAAIGKHRADFTAYDLQQYGEYCKNDCVLTYLLWNIMQQYSTPKELYVIDMLLRMFIDPVLRLDVETLSRHLIRVQQKKADLMARVDATIGGRAELMSNNKLAQVLELLGVDPPMKVSKQTNLMTYAFSKNDEAFKALLQHNDVRVQAVIAARLGIRSTLEETRTQAFIDASYRGALAILLNYYGAHTGRASGADGINLQNLPRGGALRRAMLAPPGHVLVAGDSSQIEARIVAWLAGQADLVADFAAGVDIYSSFASDVYERPVDRKRVEIDKATNIPFNPDKLEGFVGKTCILGLGFGMGDERLRQTLRIGQGGISVDLPLHVCTGFVDRYRAKYDKIDALWDVAQQAMVAVSKGFVATFGDVLPLLWDQDGIHLPNGMMIRYANLRREKGDYYYDGRYGPVKLFGGKIIENVVQALARIVVFDQMCRVEKNLRKWDNVRLGKRFRVVLSAHDEIVACVPTQVELRTKEMMVRVMGMVPKWAVGLPISCEVGSGPNYAECK
jgi:DNA polymerase